MKLEDWDNLPWTSRGLKVKYAIEMIVMLAGLFVLAGLSGMGQ